LSFICILLVVSIYLGLLIDDLNLKNIGWQLMFGWTIWMLILPLVFELVQPDLTQNDSNTPLIVRRTNNYSNLKSV
jgi:hypothetical protein